MTGLNCIKIDKNFKEIKNSNFKIKADLVLLAMGFVHPIKKGPIEELKLKLDDKGNILADFKKTILPQIKRYLLQETQEEDSH